MSPAPETPRRMSFHSEPPPNDPVIFDIDGEEFQAHSFLPGLRYMHYSLLLAKGGSMSVEAVWSFLAEAMEQAEYERFTKYVNDPSREVDTQLLGDIFSFIWAAYSNRPTERSGRSEPGPQPTEPSSTGS